MPICEQVLTARARFFRFFPVWLDGPQRNLEAVEYATLERVDGFNNRRLLGPIGDIPPVELGRPYRDTVEVPAMAAGLN